MLSSLLLIILPLIVLGNPIGIKEEGGQLFVVHFEGNIEVWNATSLGLIERSSANESLYSFDTDGKSMFFGTKNNILLVYSPSDHSWKRINLSEYSPGANIISLMGYDKDTGMLFVATDDKNIIIMNIKDFSVVKIIKGLKEMVTAISLDKDYLYLIQTDGNIGFWDKYKLDLIKNISTTKSDVQKLSQTGDTIWTALVSEGKAYLGHVNSKIQVIDLNSGIQINEFAAYKGDLRQIVSDEKYIYTLKYPPEVPVKIWNLDGTLNHSLQTNNFTAATVYADDKNLFVGTVEGGVLVYQKDSWALKDKFGDFTLSATYEEDQLTVSPTKTPMNPVLPAFVVFAIFFVIVVVLEAISATKKKRAETHKKLTRQQIAEIISSIVYVDDVLNILAGASLLILFIGIVNPKLVFPNFIPNIKINYYFDALIRNGALLPIWFLALPLLAYKITSKQKKLLRYFAPVVGIIIAVGIYFWAPKII